MSCISKNRVPLPYKNKYCYFKVIALKFKPIQYGYAPHTFFYIRNFFSTGIWPSYSLFFYQDHQSVYFKSRFLHAHQGRQPSRGDF